VILPESLKETIKQVKIDVEEMCSGMATSHEECEAAQRLLGWLEELDVLKTDELSALENALDALRRIHDGMDLRTAKGDAEKHYANRISKLINNIEEVVSLERKRRQPQPRPEPPRKVRRNKKRRTR